MSEFLEEVFFIPRISIQAFCETNEFSAIMQNLAADRRMDKVKLRLQMGGIEAAIEIYRDNPTPNMIVVENDNRKGNIAEKLQELSQYCDETTKVLIVGRTNDIMLYRRLIELGVSDYMILPVQPTDLVKAIGNIYSVQGDKPLGKVITVIGAKGGVGSSTIAHNLGFTYSRELARSTTLVDFDFPFGTLALNFNLDVNQGTADAMLSSDRLDASMIDRLMVKQSDTLSLLGSIASLEKNYDFTGDMMDGFFEAIRQVSPNIIFDVPHLWTNWSKKAIVQADHVIIVAEPDLANLRNIKNIFDTLKTLRPHDRVPYYILNNVGVPKRPEIKLNDFARAVEDEPLAIFNHDPALFGTAANNGQMLAEIEPNHPNVQSLLNLAQLVAGQKEIKVMKEKPGLMAQFAPFKEKWAKLTKKA